MATLERLRVRFPNPEIIDVETRDELGDLQEAARAARVKPDTIRMWIRRRKIEPILPASAHGPELYHLPTIEQAAQVPPGRPKTAA